ncbi:MAG: DUF3854 domain-containing protein [Myxococcota bacterium]|nr:DUF3854 domain-containing protein [Myxococcota bacterium]
MSEERPKFAPVLTDEQRATLREKHHLSDFQIDSLTGRGLRFETIVNAKLEGVTGAGEIARVLSHKTTKKVSSAPPGIVIPWFDPQTLKTASLPRLSGSDKPTNERVTMRRLRWDEPFLIDSRPGKKPAKYGQAAQIPFIVYVPRGSDSLAAIRDTSKPLVIAEGEFKTLALAQLGYAVIGIGGCDSAHDKPFKERLGAWRLHRWIAGGAFYGEARAPLCPLAGRRVLLALDGDSREKPAVDDALTRIAGMLALEGVDDVQNACPPPVPGLGKVGIDDYLAHRGPDALHAFLRGNLPRVEPQIDPRAQKIAEKREIELSRLSLHDNVTAALDALAEDPRIFVHGAGLIDLVPGGDMERLVKPSLVAERIERGAFFMGENGPESTPARLADNLASRTVGFGAVRELVMVSRDPVLRADGSVHASGYDAELRVFVEPRADAEELGDLDDVKGARELLLEAVGDFLFIAADAERESPASRAGWFAALFSCAARHLIDDPVPMHLFEAADKGAGKSLLLRLVHRIAFGSAPPDGSGAEPVELEKRLFAAALAGRRSFVIDNLQNGGALGAACLDQYLTSTLVDGRILCKSELRTVPWRAVVLAAGNNIRLRGDIHRRLVFTRIQKHDGPFRHSDITGWVEHNRTRLYAAVLTLIRAWLRAGRPRHTWQRWGGFDRWDAFVRSVLCFHNLGDPKQMQSVIDSRDDEHTSVHALLLALQPHGVRTAKELLALMEKDPELKHAVHGLFTNAELARELTQRVLTWRLNRVVGQTVKGMRLASMALDKVLRFRVDDVSGSDNPTTNQTPEHSGGSDLDAHTCEQPSDMSVHQDGISRGAAELVRLSGCPEPQRAAASFDDLFGHLPETLPDDAA